MKIAFTICSNNYLVKAKIVADTFIDYHPEYKFFIFLVDKQDDSFDYQIFDNNHLIAIQEVVQDIEQLALKYNIIELSTAVKPAVFSYLFQNNKHDIILYLDPDLQIYSRFVEVEEILLDACNNIVVTPHFCSPIDDGKFPSEIDLAPYGLFNLGFIAIKNSTESEKFISWWHERLMNYCFMKPNKGMFTDQLWVNYAPIFFKGVYILKHLGYNVANWNLYERKISLIEEGFYVNGKFKLKFFHFSHYIFDNPYMISKHQNRHSISERPDVKRLIDIYQEKLIHNRYADFSESKSYYQKIYEAHQHKLNVKKDLEYYTFKRKVINKVTNILSILIPGKI